jgi:hypothetical protein
LVLKDLQVKSLRINRLAGPETLKTGLGQFQGPFYVTAHLLTAPIGVAIVAHRGLAVCDGAHSVDVMKKTLAKFWIVAGKLQIPRKSGSG